MLLEDEHSKLSSGSGEHGQKYNARCQMWCKKIAIFSHCLSRTLPKLTHYYEIQRFLLSRDTLKFLSQHSQRSPFVCPDVLLTYLLRSHWCRGAIYKPIRSPITCSFSTIQHTSPKSGPDTPSTSPHCTPTPYLHP